MNNSKWSWQNKQIFIGLAIAVLALAFSCGASRAEYSSQPAPQTIGAIAEDLHHSQGISFSTDSIYITSVDSKAGAAFIWKFDRKSLKLIKVRDIAEGFMFHPSGLQFDGKHLRVAIAVYSKNSSSKVLRLDPDTLRTLDKFSVKDHIGLVASNGDGKLYGANWDAKTFYIWSEKGKLIETRPNPTNHGYQDCKAKERYLVCSGSGHVDFIDRETWKVDRTFRAPDLPNGNNATREGMDFIDEKFYFLPDDGAGTNIYEVPSASPDN